MREKKLTKEIVDESIDTFIRHSAEVEMCYALQLVVDKELRCHHYN